MTKPDYPITQGVRLLREKGVPFVPHLYVYEEHGGTEVAAAALGVDEYAIVKTLVMETEARRPLLILMHGNREVSTKQLARHMGVKRVEPCTPAAANKHTGYQVGGISPFGTRIPLPVYVEETILALERLYINGGKRGFLVEIGPEGLQQALKVEPVQVAIEV